MAVSTQTGQSYVMLKLMPGSIICIVYSGFALRDMGNGMIRLGIFKLIRHLEIYVYIPSFFKN